MNRTIITVVGKDTVGIIAKVCTYLAENSINILDISQTIVQEYFNMMMIVDMGKMQKTFEEVADELTNVGKAMGVQIKCQREEIFNTLHPVQGCIFLSRRKIFSTWFPLSMAPRINSSQSVSELPPRRGLDDKIRIFFDMVYLFICFFKYIYSLTNGFRPSTASAAVMRLPPLSRSMRM